MIAAKDARAAVRRLERERTALRYTLRVAARALRYHMNDIDCGGIEGGCDQCIARDQIGRVLEIGK